MSKIRLIEQCIENAERRISKLTPEAHDVPALSSLILRALMNNLGSISTRYMENGVHKSGLFCSALFQNSNIISATAIDSWESDETNEDKAELVFDLFVSKYKPAETALQKIKSDSFAVLPENVNGPIDLYLYDSDHSEQCQYDALLHFLPCLADSFIFCVDDYDWEKVKIGTMNAIRDSKCRIVFEKTLKGNDHDNDGAWNGFAIFLLEKRY